MPKTLKELIIQSPTAETKKISELTKAERRQLVKDQQAKIRTFNTTKALREKGFNKVATEAEYRYTRGEFIDKDDRDYIRQQIELTQQVLTTVRK